MNCRAAAQCGDADDPRAGLPALFVFEGGYAVAEVGVNTANVLQGFEQSV